MYIIPKVTLLNISMPLYNDKMSTPDVAPNYSLTP